MKRKLEYAIITGHDLIVCNAQYNVLVLLELVYVI